MDLPQGEDLGFGVRVSRGSDGQLHVFSPRLKLPWRVGEGLAPGTAVLWGGRPFEVVDRVATRKGERWSLCRWEEPKAMRTVFKLERASIQAVGEEEELESRKLRKRAMTLLLLPLLGLAPADLQKKWANEWGFPAERATQISAVLELAAGAAGTVQIILMAVGGGMFMPLILALPGPIFLISGIVRLASAAGGSEPIGSFLGVPFRCTDRGVAGKAEERSAPMFEGQTPPSFVRTMLVTAAVTLGPASDQLRWAEELGVRASWLTVAGAAAELVGGVSNFHDDLGSAPAFLLLLDYLLVGEGLLRMASAFTGRPMGSVFGWALRPLYRKHLPHSSSAVIDDPS